jgi:hypothetical protein
VITLAQKRGGAIVKLDEQEQRRNYR